MPLSLTGVLFWVSKSLCVKSNTEHHRLNQLLCLCLLFNGIVCFDCTTDICLMLRVKAKPRGVNEALVSGESENSPHVHILRTMLFCSVFWD